MEVLHNRAPDLDGGRVKIGGEVDGAAGRLAESGRELDRFGGLADTEGGGEELNAVV